MKILFINTIIIFIISTIVHNLYDIVPNQVTQIFFPVNESIWEHFKMLISAEILFTLFNILNKDTYIFTKALLRAIIASIILTILYFPTYIIIGEVLPVTLIILTITIFITEYLLTKIIIKNKTINILSFFIIIMMYIIFNYLTEQPPKTELFKDQQTNSYEKNIN